MRIPPFLAALATLSAAAVAAAQTPPVTWVVGGPEIQVNTMTTAYQEAPSVALGANHGFVVAWASDGQDGDDKGVFARRFDSAGLPVSGEEFQVNTTTANRQYEPAIASDSAGNFVVVWTSYVAAGQYTEVFGRRFGADGTPAGIEFQVNGYTTGYQLTPDVAMSGSGFVVTWQSLPNGIPPQPPQDGDEGGIYARRYNATGSPEGAEFRVNSTTTANQALPSVSMNDVGQFVIVWSSNDQDGSLTGIFGQRYQSNGSLDGPEFPVNSYTTSVQIRPDVAMGSVGDFVVAWQSLFQDGAQDGIFARAFNFAGTPIFGDFQVNTYTTNGQTRVAVAKSSGLPGSFVAVWDSFGPDGSPGNIGVSAQRYDNSPYPTAAFYLTQPTRRGGEYAINTYTTNAQFRPDIAINGTDGRFVVVWESFNQVNGNPASKSDIFARQFGFPSAGVLEVDQRASGGLSNVNGILEPGERVAVDPSWVNRDPGLALTLTGSAGNLIGPPGPVYTIEDATADYGTLPAESVADCFTATGNCYEFSMSATRPLTHWDATFDEALGVPAFGGGAPALVKTWSLHVGSSFPDVPPDVFYAFIENLLHNRVTAGGGCGAGLYCGEESVLRQQMAVFLLKALLGADFAPAPATGTVFDDVPASNPFAPWIEELARLQVTGGCVDSTPAGPAVVLPGRPGEPAANGRLPDQDSLREPGHSRRLRRHLRRRPLHEPVCPVGRVPRGDRDDCGLPGEPAAVLPAGRDQAQADGGLPGENVPAAALRAGLRLTSLNAGFWLSSRPGCKNSGRRSS